MVDKDIRLKLTSSGITTQSGRKVLLRGVGIGGCLNMENFITGYPGTESAHRSAIRNVVGEEKYNILFLSLINNFFNEGDASFLKSHKLNLVRILPGIGTQNGPLKGGFA